MILLDPGRRTSGDTVEDEFENPLSSTVPDPDHSEGEARFLTFGVSGEGRPLVVAHAEQDARIRVISSRLMTRRERQAYESTQKGRSSS